MQTSKKTAYTNSIETFVYSVQKFYRSIFTLGFLEGLCTKVPVVNCFSYPSLKTVRELLYKHGHGSVSGRRVPLTSNADIEKVLGRLNLQIFCINRSHCLLLMIVA